MDLTKDTKCIHTEDDLSHCCDKTGTVSFPIYQTATFAHPGVGQSTGYDYTRMLNPTVDQTERTVAGLEGAKHAISFSSGLAAIGCVMELFQPGDHIIVDSDLYGGTIRLFLNISEKNGIKISQADFAREDITPHITEKTRAVFFETPTNPMMNVIDIEKVVQQAKAADLLVIVDNTFLSPYLQNLLELGADIVIHSGTKYLGGHNDTIAGFLVLNDVELIEKLRFIFKTTGAQLSPFDAWLILRGMQTLALRMERIQFNADQVAKWLEAQPEVVSVRYPGLPGHPGHDIMKKQSRGFGGMVAFELKTKEDAVRILNHVKLIKYAESLGGTESLITYPITQTHADVPDDICEANGITGSLLRFSAGMEDVADLIADLDQALHSPEGLRFLDRPGSKERNLDFDQIIDRKNTGSLKEDFAAKRGYPEGLLSMWVADMDFRISSYIQDAVAALNDHGIYGYTEGMDSYDQAVKNWFARRHDWSIETDWIVKTPTVVNALGLSVQAFSKEGEGVLIQQPVYYPFSEVIEDNDRVIVNSPLILRNGRYEIDFDDFEEKAARSDVHLFLLCNPHNPTGRVFTREELARLGEICLANDVVIVSDEIHQDFVWDGGKHVSIAGISKEIADITVTCTSASKSFNTASLQNANIIISNEALRRRFVRKKSAAGLSQVSAPGLAATEAAYRFGDEWLDAA